MRWVKRLIIAATVMVALLVILPFFIPLDSYIPRIEKEVSDKLKEPVVIKHLRIALLPTPHASISGIEIGKNAAVRVEAVNVTPSLWSLLDETKVIRRIDVDGLLLTQQGIDKIPLWIKSDTKPGASVKASPLRVEHVQLRNSVLKLDKANVGPLDVDVSLDNTGFPEMANIKTNDGSLQAHITPGKSGLNIEVKGRSWRLPIGPAVQFDELLIKGTITPSTADLRQIDARLYSGTLNGSSKIAWQRGVQLAGQFEIKQLEIQPLLTLVSGKSSMSGKLNSSLRMNASAANAGQLVAALRAEGPFNVQNGVLYGVDIQKAATNLVTKDSSGQTRFDQLSGYIVVDRGAQQISQLQVRSGMLAAKGNVNISPRKELSGRIQAQIKASQIAAAEVPLNVTGTVDAPLLFPTGATVAGAAIGTAVLGPGVGTTVGSKIGNWAEGLFGKKQ